MQHHSSFDFAELVIFLAEEKTHLVFGVDYDVC